MAASLTPLPNVAASWYRASGTINFDEGRVDLEKKLIVIHNEQNLANVSELTELASALLQKIPVDVQFLCRFVKPTGSYETYWYRQGGQPVQEGHGFVVPPRVMDWANSDAGKIVQLRLKHPHE